MATAVIMPKQGQSVESCIIVEWKKQVGDAIQVGDALCDVETDKTTMEVPSPVAGTLLAHLYEAGADVPVMTNIAVIGTAGEEISEWLDGADKETRRQGDKETENSLQKGNSINEQTFTPSPPHTLTPSLISPRAKNLAERKGLDASTLQGSGPEGRIIERDVQAAILAQPKLTPVAKAMVAEGGFSTPAQGSGLGGRVMAKDLLTTEKEEVTGQKSEDFGELSRAVRSQRSETSDEFETIPVKGVRKLIAERMLASLQTTAQLTLNTSADARALRGYRERLKNSAEALGLRGVSINDLVLFAVSRTLPQHPFMNATFADTTIRQYKRVHLGFAVDTPRGLIVPVIRNADSLSLKQIATESKRLAQAALDNKLAADDLNGGTFTISNLGAFGIETFTPVLNPPQVGILGVGGINLKAVEGKVGVEHLPHISLSLTINHQVVDGAPAARFLQTLVQGIAQIDLLLAG